MRNLTWIAGLFMSVLASTVFSDEPVAFVSRPAVKGAGGQFEIAFELSRPTDVLVRVLGADGKVIRHLACGVLGENAPPPLQKGTLKQSLMWDGKDDDGKPVEAVAVEVKAGMKPAFGGFIGWDPEGALGRQILALDVDEAGDIYVSANPGGDQQDIDLWVFGRDGTYKRTLAPYNPNVPREALEEAKWPPTVEARLGVAVPKTEFFPSRAFYRIRGDAEVLRCGPGGDVYIRIGDDSNIRRIDPHGLSRGNLAEVLHTFALGPDGSLYVVEGQHYNDRLPVTVAKVDLKSGQRLNDFLYAGTERLDHPRFYLGTRKDGGEADVKPGLAAHVRDRLRAEAKVPGEDEASFQQIVDLAVGAEGNLYIADAGKEVVKVYSRDGLFRTEISTYERDGARLPLGRCQRVVVSRGNGSIYLVVAGAKPNTSRVVKLDGWKDARTLWTKDFETNVRALTVDWRTTPPLLWVADQQGRRGALRRIEDLGGRTGEEKVFGVGKPETLLRPGAMAALPEGSLIVYDITRGEFLKFTLKAPNDWRCEAFQSPSMGSGLGWLGGLSKTLHVDPRRGQIYIAHPLRGGEAGKDGWYLLRFDADGKSVPFTSTGTDRVRLRGPVRGIATDREGNIYLTTVTQKTIAVPMRPLYLMSKEEIQKAIESVESDGPYPQIRRSRIGWAHVDVLAPDGTLAKKSLISPYGSTGVTVDSRGGIYVMDSIYDIDFGKVESAGIKATNSEIGYLVKFGPSGGWRNRDELWVHPGVSPVNGLHCGCCTGYMTVDLDDRVFVTDTARFQVKVLDVAGNVIGYIGTYGNRDCAGPQSRNPQPDVPFRGVAGVAVVGDDLYVSDDLSKRIVRCVLGYQLSGQAVID